MIRNGGLVKKFARLTWRVWAAIAIWFLPNLVGMERAHKESIQQAAVALLVGAVASWIAQQGRRKPPDEPRRRPAQTPPPGPPQAEDSED